MLVRLTGLCSAVGAIAKAFLVHVASCFGIHSCSFWL